MQCFARFPPSLLLAASHRLSATFTPWFPPLFCPAPLGLPSSEEWGLKWERGRGVGGVGYGGCIELQLLYFVFYVFVNFLALLKDFKLICRHWYLHFFTTTNINLTCCKICNCCTNYSFLFWVVMDDHLPYHFPWVTAICKSKQNGWLSLKTGS